MAQFDVRFREGSIPSQLAYVLWNPEGIHEIRVVTPQGAPTQARLGINQDGVGSWEHPGLPDGWFSLRVQLATGEWAVTPAWHTADDKIAYFDVRDGRVVRVAPPPEPGEWLTPSLPLGISVYGILGRPLDEIGATFAYLRARGFTIPRIGVNWRGTDRIGFFPGAAAIDMQGNVIDAGMVKLLDVVRLCADLAMIPDLSFFWPDKSDSAQDIQERGAQNLARSLATLSSRPTVVVDVANEYEGFHTERIAKSYAGLRAIYPQALYTSSLSVWDDNPEAEGHNQGRYETSKKYRAQSTWLGASSPHVAMPHQAPSLYSPHFPRDGSWYQDFPLWLTRFESHLQNTHGGKYPTSAAKSPRPVWDQEPHRRHYNAIQPTYDHFMRYFDDVKVAKFGGRNVWGSCFHTGAGFDPRRGSFLDQLDDVERRVVEDLGARMT